jgi:hypothetical protein
MSAVLVAACGAVSGLAGAITAEAILSRRAGHSVFFWRELRALDPDKPDGAVNDSAPDPITEV